VIEVVLFDIDGVLTDGTLYIGPDGEETKRISFKDIDAIFELKRAGIKIGFISGEDNRFTDFVKRRFSPDYFVAGTKDKLASFRELSQREGFDESKVCFVGDSKKDMELLSHLHHSFAPFDADDEVRRCAGLVTQAERGCGVICEVARYVLQKPASAGAPVGNTDLVRDRLREHSKVMDSLQEDSDRLAVIVSAAEIATEALKQGGTLFFCGNGGSAADSQHIATEMVSSFLLKRQALAAEALTVNTSTLTAIGNDTSFDEVFSRQLEARGHKGDVLFAISTSGNSKNITRVLETARSMGITTIGMTGNNEGCLVRTLSDHCISVPSGSTPRIQEAHIAIAHIICEIIEKNLAG
jgi:D-sedoheptulose 7-phosphate isomerase